MKKWVIAFMLLAFTTAFTGCYGDAGSCPHGICSKDYYEKNGSPDDSK